LQNIPPIEVLPTLNKKCKFLALLLTFILFIFPILLSIYFWYLYDEILIAIFLFLFLQIISGIIIAKIRTNTISFDQREINYSTYEIIKWYISKNICQKNN